jgi:hypothetical protein
MRRVLGAIYRGWMAFAHVLGTVQTFVLLALIYFVVLGIIAPLFRLFSGDPLDRRLHDRRSVWAPKGRTNVSLEEARHLF